MEAVCRRRGLILRYHLVEWYAIVTIMMTMFLVIGGTRVGFGLWYMLAPLQEREYLMDALRPHIDGSSLWVFLTGTALLTFFPRIFRVLFNGFYPLITLVLIFLIFRMIALTLRMKLTSRVFMTIWDIFIAMGNTIPFFLLGLTAGYILKGVPLFNEGKFNVEFLGYFNHFTIAVGLLTVCAGTALSYTAIAWNSDGITRIFARRWAFYSSLIMCVLIFDLSLWSLVLSPYVSSSLTANRFLVIVPVIAFSASAVLPYLLWKRRFKAAYITAVVVMTGLALTFFLTIYPNLRVIFSRTNPSRTFNPQMSQARRAMFSSMTAARDRYFYVYIFLMATTAFLHIRMFRLYHKRVHCPLPYDEEEDEL